MTGVKGASKVDDGSANVVVANDGAAVKSLKFTAFVQDSSGASRDADVRSITVQPSADIAAFTVKRFTVSITVVNFSDTLTGQLVVQASGVSSATRPLVLAAPGGTNRRYATWVLWLSLLVAGAEVAFRARRQYEAMSRGRRFKLGNRVGPANWDLSQSWASTLTVVAAVLGTIVGAGVLPATTHYVSKGGFTGLNLFFGVLAVAAPFAFNSARVVTNLTAQVKELKYEGYVWSFLLSSALTLWAVLGELATLGLLFAELEWAGSLSRVALIPIGVAIAVAIVGVLYYAWRSIGWVLAKQTEFTLAVAERLAQVPRERVDALVAEKGEPTQPPWAVM